MATNKIDSKRLPEETDSLQVVDPNTGNIKLHDLCVALFGEVATDGLVLNHGAFCGYQDYVDSVEDAYRALSEDGLLDPFLLGKFDAFLITPACRRLELVQNIVRTKRDLRMAIKACDKAASHSARAFSVPNGEIDLGRLTLSRALASLDAEFKDVWQLKSGIHELDDPPISP